MKELYQYQSDKLHHQGYLHDELLRRYWEEYYAFNNTMHKLYYI